MKHAPDDETQSTAHAHPAHHEHGHAHGAHGGSDHHEHDFSNVEAHAKMFDAADRDAWQKPAEVVTLTSITPGQTVVDLGAGTGYFSSHLSRAVGPGGKVLALDVEPKMVDHMKKRVEQNGWSNVTPALAPMDGPGLDASSVDRILIVNTWHHIPSRGDYSKKLAQSLRPGGLVVVVDFTLDAPMGPPQSARIAPERVAEELAQGGLTTQIASESLPHQYVVVGRK